VTKLTTVQALRAVAALLVAIYHLFLNEQAGITNNGSEEISALLETTRNGFAGVDMFFVISGFIMVYVTQNTAHGKYASLDFLIARLTRIYPLWWFFCACFLVIIVAGTGQLTPASYNIEAEQTAGFLVRSFLLWPQEKLPYIVVGWTLIHELYFYAIFAGFMLAPRAWLPVLAGVWCLVLCIGATAGLSTDRVATGILSLAFHPLTLEFIFGVAIGLLVTKGIRTLALPAFVIGTTVFVGGLLFFTHDMVEISLNWSRVVLFGIPSAFILYGLVSLELEKGWSAPSQLVYLGDASYALYLGHVVIYLVATKAFEVLAAIFTQLGMPAWLVAAFSLGHSGPVDNLLFGVFGFSGALICAGLTFSCLEKGSLSWLSGKRRALMQRVRMDD